MNITGGSMRTRIFVALIAALIVVSSCVSVQGPATPSPTAKPVSSPVAPAAPQPTSTPALSQTSPAADTEIIALQEKAKNSLESNHLTEAIKFYISAYLRASKSGNTAKINEIGRAMNDIGTRLTIEPLEAWLAPSGEQIVGDTRQLSKADGLMPAVYLFESYQNSKTPVQDAVIKFEFIENEGSLTASVATDKYGLANANIASLAHSGKSAIIRAYPVFSNEGFSYAFKNVNRDFVYAPPKSIALVAGIEKTSFGNSANPLSIDSIAQIVKTFGIDVIPFNGTVQADKFLAAFNGDSKSLALMNADVKAGYYTLFFIEVNAPVQLQLQGKIYNIFNTSGKATLRIVRNDGSIVYTFVKDGVKGQGGTDKGAVDDCLLKLRDEIARLINENSAAIKKAFLE